MRIPIGSAAPAAPGAPASESLSSWATRRPTWARSPASSSSTTSGRRPASPLRDAQLTGRANLLAEERLNGPADGVGVVGERPMTALAEDDQLGVRERLALTLRQRDRQVRVVRAPDDQRGDVVRA